MQDTSITISPSTATTFTFGNQPVRVVMRDNQPWFVTMDVATALGYRIAPHITRHLDEDEVRIHILDTNRGPREFTIISESGLYTAILKSRRPEAKQFKRWVTSEVLPSIRKTGSYSIATPPKALPDCRKLLPDDLERINFAIELMAIKYQKGSDRTWAWKRLYAVTNTKSTSEFRVEHLPIIERELTRIWCIVNDFSLTFDMLYSAIQRAESTAIYNIERNVDPPSRENLSFNDLCFLKAITQRRFANDVSVKGLFDLV